MKIAIIGSGISGLSAYWLLSKKHEVTIFEKYFSYCTPGRIRTYNLLIRSQMLYPVEPRVLFVIKI